MDVILQALSLVFEPTVLLTIIGASALGVLIGAIPGLTAVMGTALLVPITFFMEPVAAVSAIAAMAAMAIFAGDIPGALLRIPGTPASAAYVDESYALTKAGKPEVALGLAMASACAGGVIGTLLLMFAAPMLAKIATGFSSVEYFWLALLGLSCAAIVATGSPLKGALSLLFGLFIATIGIDVIAGQARFTFGSTELMGGVSFIPAMIGMFAFSEIVRTLGRPANVVAPHSRIGPVFKGLFNRLRKRKVNLLRGGLAGSAIGALPGAGADIAAWVSYSVAKKRSATPQAFGTGHDEGLVEAGAANNGALSGAWVPTLVFGIPGDSITAIVIGVLYLKGLEPGPIIFIKTPELVYAVFVAFLLANLLLLPLGWLIIRLSRYVLRIPQSVFLPIVLMCCMIGSFAINNSLFGIGVMLVFGIIGWIFEENGIPVAPAILGLVLGGMVEFNFVTSLLKSDGDLMIFFSRPLGAMLGVITIAIWVVPLVRTLMQRRSTQRLPTNK